MIFLKRFILMIQFFTTIPIKKQIDANERDFGKGLVFAPLVGFIIGGILLGVYILLRYLLDSTAAIFVIVFYVFLTGGLHFDGLGDTFDGIFSRKPKERIIEIMRDSRVGTNAVLAIILVLLIYFKYFFDIEHKYLIYIIPLFPVSGRIGSLVGASISKYAFDKGMGKSFVDHCTIKECIIGLLVALIIAYILLQIQGLILIGYSIFTAIILTLMLKRKLNGVTGDILGAICELNQALFLIGAYILFYKF